MKTNCIAITVLECAKEKRRRESLPYKIFLFILMQFLTRNGMPDKGSAEKSKPSDQTIREFTIRIMSDRGRATQAATGWSSLKQNAHHGGVRGTVRRVVRYGGRGGREQ